MGYITQSFSSEDENGKVTESFITSGGNVETVSYDSNLSDSTIDDIKSEAIEKALSRDDD